MDPSSGFSAKKDRNQKRQRDKFHKKRPGVSSEDQKPESDSPESNALPQRANRRNERQPDNSSLETVQTATQDNQVLEETIAVDHSHLKRETEEIDKLTKKFENREIVSNWTRFTIPETENDVTKDDEDAPADFCELLRMSTSRGGHFQLKEEKEWSSASKHEPSDYYALNLELLNLGVQCTPVYERFHLPKHVFCEEDISEFDAQTEEAKNVYNSSNLDDSNFMTILKECFKASEGIHESELDMEKINSVPIQKNENFVNLLSFAEMLSDKGHLVENDNERHNNKEDTINPNIVETKATTISFLTALNQNKSSQITSNFTVSEKDKELLEHDSSASTTLPDSSCKIELKLQNENNSSVPFCLTNTPINSEPQEGLSHHSKSLEPSTYSDSLYNTEEKETNVKVKANEKMPIKETKSKESNVFEKYLSFTDDNDDNNDDLDFLLTLKTPAKQETETENKMLAVKDSLLLSGETLKTQTVAQKEHSDLDDWLDSVLQD